MVDFSHFHTLDPDAYRVTMELHARAEREELVIAFVFRWMAFNGWAAAVTGEERDADMIAALAEEPRITAAFDALIGANKKFRSMVDDFAGRWPVLSVSGVRAKLGYDAFRKFDRPSLLAACRAQNVRLQPRDWAGGRPDWGQLLRVIYQVRCNLFHGEKSEQNVRDRALITASNDILAMLVTESGCYSWHGQ